MLASIIIPVYNECEALSRCLQALQRQTVAPGDYEIIVVDDASTDGSAEVARAYGAMVISQAARQGPAAARNTGAMHAQSDILLFLDADCEPAPDWCAEMLCPLVDPAVSGVYGAYRTHQTGLVARFAQTEFDERYARLAQHERIDFLATHAAAIRRHVFLKEGGFRVDMWGNEDVELAFRLAQHGYKLVFAPHAVIYHEHPSTLWRYLQVKLSRGYWRTLAYARHPQKALMDVYTPPWLKWQVVGVMAVALLLLLSIVQPVFFPLLFLAAGGLLLTTIPFTAFVQRTYPELLFIAPWLSLLRSVALGIGICAGLVALLINLVRRRIL